MTDAKELVKRARYLCGWMHSGGEWDQTVRQAMSDNADWIERWAPVIEKVRAVVRAQEAVCQYGLLAIDQLHEAQSDLASAAIAALGEDKP